MIRKTRLRVIVALLLCSISLTAVVIAQSVGSISGKVLDKTTNLPVAGATVVAISTDFTQSKTAITDEQGNYRLDLLFAAKYNLSVEKEGYSRGIQQTITLAENEEKTSSDILLPLEGIVSGVIKDNSGAPLANIEAQAILGDGTGTSFGRAFSDIDGTYQIKGLAEGSYTVAAKADGLVPDKKESVQVVSGQETKEIDFTLEKGTTVAGFVKDINGNLLQGVDVLVIDSSTNKAVSSAITDENGSFQFEYIPVSTYIVSVTKKEYIDQEQKDVLAEEGKVATVNFVLKQGIAVTGKVLKSDGVSGIQGAVILPARSDASATPDVGAVTSEDGSYRIESLEEGNYTLSLAVNGVPLLSATKQIALKLGETYDDINFILPTMGGIKGKVYSDNNTTPFAGVNIMAVEEVKKVVNAVKTDAQGGYIINDLPEGKYILTISADGFPSLLLHSIVVKADEVTNVHPAVIGVGNVSGKVTSSSGAPLEDVNVIARAEDPLFSVKIGKTVLDGTYAFSDLPSGQYKIVAVKAGFHAASKTDVMVNVAQTTNDVNLVLNGP